MEMANLLKAPAPNLWTLESGHRFLGVDFGGRMTVIRLASGDLFIHSPVRLSDDLREELDTLGSVKYIIAPNRFHHLYIGEYVETYPEAELYAAPGLTGKRRDVAFTGELADGCRYGWGREIEHTVFGGIPALSETVFFHPESRTLILTDLLFNFSHSLSAAQVIFARLNGVYLKPGVSRLTHYLFLKSREEARESAERILSWDFDRVLLAHKDTVDSGGHKAVRKAFEVFGS